jgi:hypothetical protein
MPAMSKRTVLFVASSLTVAFVLVLAYALSVGAQDQDDDSCYYQGENYPSGYEMCQGDTLKRCEYGSWTDIGDCEAPPE